MVVVAVRRLRLPLPNPVPTLTSISPISATAGGAAFTLTVDGSNFISSSVVRWGGQSRTTTYVSSTQLTAAISASDIATAGPVEVTVFNPSPGGGSVQQPGFHRQCWPDHFFARARNAFAGGRTFALTVNGANFIDTSVVRWNGSDRITTFLTQHNAGRRPSSNRTSPVPGSASVTVFNPGTAGGESDPLHYSILTAAPLVITTSSLPDTTGGKTYYVTLASTGGIPPITWAITTGSPPLGLGFYSDYATDRGDRECGGLGHHEQLYRAGVRLGRGDTHRNAQPEHPGETDALGSNDTCPAGATPISNGRIRASISPYGDIDVYSFQGTAGAEVTIEIFAQRLDLDNDPTTRDSQLDSIIELLNSSCTPIAVNDDIDPGIIQDSRISVSSTPFPPACWYTPCGDIPPPPSLPYTGTYYIRVRDLRGDGRPDLIYELSLSGAN